MISPSELPEAPAQVADAPPDNWVDRFAPRATVPYLRLSRADRPIGTWLLFIPCLWGVALAAMGDGFRAWDLWIALSCGIGAFLMRGAGCTWNDITDRHIDGQVARTRSRPIPSGQVTVKGALIWMVVQALIAAMVLFSYNRLAIALGFASLALVAVYPFAKRFTWWPQVFLGLAFNWGAVLAFAAHAGHVSAGALALYGAGIVWTLYYDTIYALQDKEDDAMIGIKSTARLFGDNVRPWLWGFIAVMLVLLGLAIALTITPATGIWPPMIALAGVWIIGWHMALQMRQLDVENPASCLRVFRANRDTGLILALFLAIASFV